YSSVSHRPLHSFPTRRSSDLVFTGGSLQIDAGAGVDHTTISGGTADIYGQASVATIDSGGREVVHSGGTANGDVIEGGGVVSVRSEEHTSELQSLRHLVCRLL